MKTFVAKRTIKAGESFRASDFTEEYQVKKAKKKRVRPRTYIIAANNKLFRKEDDGFYTRFLFELGEWSVFPSFWSRREIENVFSPIRKITKSEARKIAGKNF